MQVPPLRIFDVSAKSAKSAKTSRGQRLACGEGVLKMTASEKSAKPDPDDFDTSEEWEAAIEEYYDNSAATRQQAMDLRGVLKMMVAIVTMGVGMNCAVWGLGGLTDFELKRRARKAAAAQEASKREEERRVRELSLYFEQSALIALHADEVEQWCDWVEREPSLDEPHEVWSRWLDEAKPIYLLTFGSPNVCWLPREDPRR